MAETTREVRERPILFSGEMVRAILDGRKTQTRRVVKDVPLNEYGESDVLECGWFHPTIIVRGEEEPGDETFGAFTPDGGWATRCPYGVSGDHLWVRETHLYMPSEPDEVMYADHEDYDICREKSAVLDLGWRVRPSIHMPRAFSRLTLEITDVCVERLHDISDADAVAEGVWPMDPFFTPSTLFRAAWAGRYGMDAANANPWVWALTFCVVPDGWKRGSFPTPSQRAPSTGGNP